jgi:hypothetical protein
MMVTPMLDLDGFQKLVAILAALKLYSAVSGEIHI